MEYKKDLALSYYMQGDFNKSMAVIRPVVESNQADIQSYQILGMVYKAVNENRDAERMYRAAIRKFPESGVLYNDFGELLWSKGDFVTGIEAVVERNSDRQKLSGQLL